MSGRIRTVKPEWLEDELLALASPEARVLSIGLMLLADDHGNGRANPMLLAGQVFPGKPLELAAGALTELRGIRFVFLYEVDGQRYFSIRNWKKHQRVDKPGKNRVPFSHDPGAKIIDDFACPVAPPETSGVPPEPPQIFPASRASEVVVQVVVGGPGPDPDPSVGIRESAEPTPGAGPPAKPQPSVAGSAHADDSDSGVQASVPTVRDAQRMALHWGKSPQDAAMIYGAVEAWPEVKAIARAFQETWGRVDDPRTAGDPRSKVILARFAEGYTADRLILAVRGSKFDEHILSNASFQTLVTIFRDAAQIDKFASLKSLPRKAGTKEKQPEGGNWKLKVEKRS